MQDSPAYRLNHEEVQKALEEGINFVELMSPTEAVPDEHGAVKALVFEKQNYNRETGKFSNAGEFVELAARTVCVACRNFAERHLRKRKARNVPVRRMAAVFQTVQSRAQR
jgi:NADPH-dependent glutamate synthase beta subunit-like oxidoreductase